MTHNPSFNESAHRATEFALRERVKELACLYEMVGILTQPDASIDQRMARVVGLLPRAWQHPESAIARITLDGAVHQTSDFDHADHVQQAEIRIAGIERGRVEVGYPADALPASMTDPFLAEERSLIENVAHQIAVHVERYEIETHRRMLEDQLRHADRLATIGQLASGVAHEMNDPLSGILGFAQLALKAPDVPPRVAEDLNEIVAASLRAREIVKKLLLFARQTPPQKSPTDLNAIIQDALVLLEAGCDKPGVQLVQQLAADLPPIEADPVQMRQVIVNLAVNAIQAIAVDGIVTVETRVEDGRVVLSVADTGQGMSPETQNRIFTPFYTTKDVGEGTGLGLSVVHGIVAAHGARIEVDSALGVGSRFVVRFAVADEARHAEEGKRQ